MAKLHKNLVKDGSWRLLSDRLRRLVKADVNARVKVATPYVRWIIMETSGVFLIPSFWVQRLNFQGPRPSPGFGAMLKR